MVFHTFSGELMLTLHMPNDTPNERPFFFGLEDTGTALRRHISPSTGHHTPARK